MDSKKRVEVAFAMILAKKKPGTAIRGNWFSNCIFYSKSKGFTVGDNTTIPKPVGTHDIDTMASELIRIAEKNGSDLRWFIDPKSCRVTRKWHVYGEPGHRQGASFGKSTDDDFSTADELRLITTNRCDRTGTNDYAEVIITKNSAEQCARELSGQITDGIFENYRVGGVVEIKEGMIGDMGKKLKPHIGHNLECVYYGDYDNPHDICIEDTDTNEVIISAEDYDAEEDDDATERTPLLASALQWINSKGELVDFLESCELDLTDDELQAFDLDTIRM